MKKTLIFMVLLICTIVANAATYRVKYDVNNQRKSSFIVKVESNRLTIGSSAYNLRRMGTITNSGLTFNSYAYGSGENGMFCVSTTSITVEKGLDLLCSSSRQGPCRPYIRVSDVLAISR